MLGHDLPRLSNPPSLAGSLSTDPHDTSSGAVTPELQQHSKSGEIWGQMEGRLDAGGKKAHRPKITVCTTGSPQLRRESAITPDDHIGVRDFAVQELDQSPVIGSYDEDAQSGVELPLDALITLQKLSLQVPTEEETVSEPCPTREMEESHYPARSASPDATPASDLSDLSFSQMSVPSPSEFFSSLGKSARHTWHISSVPNSALPPSSTTAEQFYNCPWNEDRPVEHVVELDDAGSDTEGPPTARQMPLTSESNAPTEIVIPEPLESPLLDQDEDYDKAIQESAAKTLDRTSMWLAQQSSYLSALRETNPVNDISAKAKGIVERPGSHKRNDSLGSPIRKAVRFLESEAAKEEYHPALPREPIYHQAFQHITSNSYTADVFRHRLARSDSIQSVRSCLPHEHLKRLRGEYRIDHIERPNPLRPISMMPGKEPSDEEQTPEQKVIARVERERQALEQVNARSWIVEASKYLTGGSLLNSPAGCRTIKNPKLGDIQNGRVVNPGRILDLGGLPDGDWAWHCAREFPHAKVYTATTETHPAHNSIQGPRNHRTNPVSHLWQLPYPSNHFNAISARALHTYLKNDKPSNQSADEYDLTLAECLRCLKPGGYFEFSTMDAEIVHAGPAGTAASVEFAFNLKTRGYDPVPTRSWLARIKKAGFDDIKRAWTFLPMGSSVRENLSLPETPPPDVPMHKVGEDGGKRVSAVQGPVGSTADAAAVSGLVGSWAWEQWILRLQTEMGHGDLLGTVGDVLEEGKECGAGWRMLQGWARKPLENGAVR